MGKKRRPNRPRRSINKPKGRPYAKKHHVETPSPPAPVTLLQQYIKMRVKGILVGMALLGGVVGGYLHCTSQEKQSDKIIRSSPKSERPKENFDFQKYIPPNEGVIVKSDFNPTNKKTIIYIPDHHANKNLPKSMWPLILKANREQYFILVDLLNKYGKVPLALESWLNGFNIDDAKKPDALKVLPQDLLSTNSFEKRKQIALNKLNTRLVRGARVFLATYQDDAIPIGTVSPEEFTQIVESEQLMNNYINYLDDPSQFTCADMSMDQVEVKFSENEKTSAVIDCYCKLHAVGVQMKDILFNRVRKIARQEIRSAAAYDHQYIVVVAGTQHLPEAMREMKKQNVNYHVVFPKSLAPIAESLLSKDYAAKDPATVKTGVPDDNEKTCEHWAQQNPAKAKTAKDIFVKH